MTTPPKTLFWFRLYCVALMLLYLSILGAGIALLVVPEESIGVSRTQAILYGSVLIIMGIIFSFLSLLGFFLPPRPGGWVIGFVLILMGITSLVLLPLSVPLLVFWKKPPVQTWFRRNAP